MRSHAYSMPKLSAMALRSIHARGRRHHPNGRQCQGQNSRATDTSDEPSIPMGLSANTVSGGETTHRTLGHSE
jgi:hypothetical protein